MTFISCTSTEVRRFRVLDDSRIEINDPPGWGIYLIDYLRATELSVIPSNAHWTLIRTRSEGQKVSVMLKNMEIPDLSRPLLLCLYANFVAPCHYATYVNWIVSPFCPASFPNIGK
jgi:hypothetical protein